jgi:branched-chain amino acid transport system permease protein
MEKRKIEVNGVTMAYNTAGQGSPVLFIHGNTGSKIWFEKVMEIEGLRTVAPDMPNFGASDHLEHADIDLYADYIRDFIKTMGLPAPLPVVGHSLGGAVAISLTIRNPELVSRLMLVDSAPMDGLKTPEEHYPVIEMYKDNYELLYQALQAVTPTMDDPDYLNRLAEQAMKMNPIAFAGNARALDRFDYTGKGAEFDGPVTVVVGDQDVLITQDMAKATADAFPKGTLKVLNGVGHSVMAEAPDTFISLVKEFTSS